MVFKKWICITVVTVFFIELSLAQHPDFDAIIEELAQDIVEDVDEDLDYSELLERLGYYLKNPINLNTTDGRELIELYFLSPMQIQELTSHRESSGPFISTYELQSINGFDERLIQRLIPFVTISDENDLDISKLSGGNHDLMLRYGRILESQKGYQAPEKPSQAHFMGTPERLFVRYRFKQGNRLQVALNMKKDAGEEFFSRNQRQGFDFYSGGISIREFGRVKSLVVGDYALQLGQGLSLWNGLSFGKGSLVQNVARQGVGLRLHTSTNESEYLRGLATNLKFGKLEILPFISYKKIDASLASDSLSFSSIGVTGYHRTPSEFKNRNSVSTWSYGLGILYNNGNLRIGGTTLKTSFDKPMVPNQQLYNQYSFRGKSLVNSSIYYHYTYRNIYFYGEGSHSFQGGYGFVNGLIGSLSQHLSLVLLHRYYQRDFHSFMNQGFAENSRALNEKGMYTGLIWNPNRRVEWVAYADYFKFPWLRYRVDGPSQGFDLFSQFSFSPRKTLNFLLRYRYRNKQENTLDNSVNLLDHVVRNQARLEVKYKVFEAVQFRNRFEFTNYSKGLDDTERGFMIYHDLVYKPVSKAYSGNLRLAAFQTDSYNSRVYAFENDVLYGYSFPPYYNSGLRLYANLRYRIKKGIDFWFRYAIFLYADDGIGSALDYIEGNRKSDIRLQLRFQF